ncbi:hypothetical protein F5884DRAFT_710180, partial [Xylogone sp. PMI_703]
MDQADLKRQMTHLDKLIKSEKFSTWKQRMQRCRGLGTPVSSEYQCTFCISALTDDDMVRGLPCNHCYHKACIDPWFSYVHRTCPLC